MAKHCRFLRVVKSDIDRETKGMGGVENLAKALQETPKFGGEESQQDVQEKLQHMRSMLTFLEATRYETCFFILVQTCLELFKLVRKHSNLSQIVQTCLKLFKLGSFKLFGNKCRPLLF